MAHEYAYCTAKVSVSESSAKRGELSLSIHGVPREQFDAIPAEPRWVSSTWVKHIGNASLFVEEEDERARRLADLLTRSSR